LIAFGSDDKFRVDLTQPMLEYLRENRARNPAQVLLGVDIYPAGMLATRRIAGKLHDHNKSDKNRHQRGSPFSAPVFLHQDGFISVGNTR
jgi:hypothetical protein